MGEHLVEKTADPETLRVFMQKVLDDLRALERMLAEERFETGVRRLGAEQELFLIDAACRPAPVSQQVLEAIDDRRFTTELARFNLEANLDPLEIGEKTLSQLYDQLTELLQKAAEAAAAAGAEILLCGILPTLEQADLTLDNMTPVPRYFALAEAVARLRGGEFEYHIKGIDELTTSQDSVMGEACNTSFQIHFQVDPASFARFYNVAQAVTAPVLAAASNSPLLFGRRLWRETRIALFRQSVDTRGRRSPHRQMPPRVAFGDHWLDDSVLEIFREDIARFRLLLSTPIEEESLKVLENGGVPRLRALTLHNGTIYRWNRPCYGITNGLPHLRIENRILPSGPTAIDEVANCALWLGLLAAVEEEYGDVRRHLSFDQVKENFVSAARLGPKAQLSWCGDRSMTARELLLEELLPRARQGLSSLGIGDADRDLYLGVVEERIKSRRTGCQWQLDSLAAMQEQEGAPVERLAALTAAMVKNQRQGNPVHTWARARLHESRELERHYSRVASVMTTDLFTVHENDVIDLVASLMDWRHVRHVPVEDDAHRLVGLVTHRDLLRVLAENYGKERRPIPVREVMKTEVVTVTPATHTLEAVELMKKHKIACLPVIENGKLAGIVTERDFMKIFRQLLENFLGDSP